MRCVSEQFRNIYGENLFFLEDTKYRVKILVPENGIRGGGRAPSPPELFLTLQIFAAPGHMTKASLANAIDG